MLLLVVLPCMALMETCRKSVSRCLQENHKGTLFLAYSLGTAMESGSGSCIPGNVTLSSCVIVGQVEF